MYCFVCKWHETFSDEIDGEWISDGCVCNHEQAEEENRHTKCCWDYNGKEKCPYKEEDDE